MPRLYDYDGERHGEEQQKSALEKKAHSPGWQVSSAWRSTAMLRINYLRGKNAASSLNEASSLYAIVLYMSVNWVNVQKPIILTIEIIDFLSFKS